MSIADTAQAKKYASIAEIAAAQAKEYANKLSLAPDYAEQAKESADLASSSATNAALSQNSAADSASSASSFASSAAASASEAESAASLVFSSSLHAPLGETLTVLPSASERANTVPVFDGSGDAAVKDISDFAILDSSGKIPVSMIPAIALSEVFVVSSQAEMLALTAQEGDIAKRTDLGYSFILASEPASTLSNWVQVSDDVLAELGMSAGATQIGAVDDSNNPTTVQGALALKASLSALAAPSGVNLIGGAAKISALASTGGAETIGTSTGDTVQSAIDTLKNNVPLVPKDYFVGSFFASNTDDSLSLFSSQDGKNFTKINATGLTPTNTTVVGNRDPSIIYFKNYWYVAATTGGTSGVGSTDADFLIFKSQDLLTWTLYKCFAGATKLKGQAGSVIGGTIATIAPIWAPSLIIINNELWVQLNIGYKPQAVDVNGTLVNWCAPFASRCSDTTNMSFEFPQLIMTDTSVQRIDVDMTSNPAGGYVMSLKNEYNKHIEIWKSPTYINGYTKIADLDFGGIPVEGPSLVWLNGLSKWRLYADAFNLNGTTYYVESTDLVTWGTPIVVQSPWPLRHGSVQNLANLPEAEKAINSFSQAASVMLNNNILPCWSEGATLVAGSQTLIPKLNYVYRVSSSVNATVVINEKGGEWFYLLVGSGLSPAGITVSGTAVDGAFSVGFGQTNLRIFKVWYNATTQLYEVEGQPNQKGDSAAFSAQTGWPAITTAFIPTHGRMYTTSGSDTSNTVISGLPSTLPDGTFFHLWIGSETATGSITINSGATNCQVGSVNVVLSGSTGNGNKIYTLKKISGLWRVMAY